MKPCANKQPGVMKFPTGIHGLDDITGGGLPGGRPTLVCGSAGSGKTLAMESIVCGARDYGEPGVFMVFEGSRGIPHSSAVRGFRLTSEGIQLEDAP